MSYDPAMVREVAQVVAQTMKQWHTPVTDIQIAKATGTSRNTVARQRKQNKLPMRDAGKRTTGKALAMAGILIP